MTTRICRLFSLLAIDSLVYAAALWGIRFGIKAFKHNRRRRTGRRVHCGYPLGCSPVCTECGNPLPE